MGIYSSMAPGVPRCSKHTRQHYALAHPLLLSYLAMLPVRHTLSNMVLVPKKCGQLSQKQDFAEDTVGSKFGAPELGPRKSLLHGTNFYCLGLSTAKPKIAPFLDFLALKAAGQYCCYAPPRVQLLRPNSTRKVSGNRARHSSIMCLYMFYRTPHFLSVWQAVAPRWPRCGPASPQWNLNSAAFKATSGDDHCC